MIEGQWRAARALIGWSQTELAETIGVSVLTIKRLESGGRIVSEEMRTRAKAALEAAGVEFTNGDAPGVRLRRDPKGADEISRQIEALEHKISRIPRPAEPSPEAGMNLMRKAVAENDLRELRNRRSRNKTKRPPK